MDVAVADHSQAPVRLTVELDTFYQLCCDEDAASTACSAAAASSLPCFTLTPDDEDLPEQAPPPVSPAVSLPAPLLAYVVHLHVLCAESTAEASASLYSVLLSRLMHLLPQSATPLNFRLSVVQLLSLLMLPPASTSPSCQSFLSSHLYRLTSLLLPPSLLSSSVAAALLRLVDGLLASGGPISRSVCVNVRKYVEGWKDERERRRLQRQADDSTAYFAAGGEVDASTRTLRAEAIDKEADGALEGGVIVAGKRRRRIEPDPSMAALFPYYPTADDEDTRPTALIEQLRAEQKVALTEKKLRVKGESLEDEWRREWRRWMEDEDDNDAEERIESQTADASEVRNSRFWRQWEEGTEWRRFLPSSLTESPPPSSRPHQRKVASEIEIESKEESKEAGRDEGDEVLPLSAAELAQVEAAASRGFSSSYFVPAPVVVAQPSHFVHPSRVAAAFPPAFQPGPMGLPFAPFSQPLPPPFMPPQVFHAGMQR